MTNGMHWRSRLLTDYWFSHLPAALQDSLLSLGRQRRKTPGKCLFKRGDPACGLYALLEGSVRMGSAEQQRLAPRLEEVRTPYWFGEVSLFDGVPRTLDACSMQQSIFLHVAQADLQALLAQQPEYWRHFAGLLSYKLGLPLPTAAQMTTLPERARVAWRLLLLCEGYGHLSHARRLVELADIDVHGHLGVPWPNVLAVLEDLQQRKIIRLGDTQLEVFEPDKLRKVANVLRAQAPV